MSNLIPSSFRNSSQPDSSSSASPSVSSPRPANAATAIPQALYTDCQTCRVTGTATFSAVGLYALTVARSQAKTRIGKATASAAGLGFLAIAAARWTAYSPPPSGVEEQVGNSSQA